MGIGWTDVVDIALIGYILFRLYVLFRNTPALRVIIGIGVLWMFQRAAANFHLVVTSWAFQGIVAAGAIIWIVIFRNEIRLVLQTKNLKTILWGIPNRTSRTPIEVVSDSVFELSNRRHGALIVFEVKEALEAEVYSGVPWDGKISKEMILSIFWPDNPVHDGAVVIRGDRISEVGVILPVSRRDDVPSHFGTRHRAAIGLTENSDALVVIVSEETGKVSVGRAGKLHTVRGKSELERILKGVMRPDSVVDLRRNLMRQAEYAVAATVCLLLVVGLWFSFTQGMDTIVSVDVPIEYINRPPGMEIVHTSVNAISTRLSGSGMLFKSIRPDQIQVRLDLSKAQAGKQSFSITGDNIKIPPGTLLKEVAPNVVDVTLDVLVKKELPIQIDWVGKLPDNLIMTDSKPDPQKITIIGASSILNGISTVYTEKIRLDGIKESGEISASVQLDPASLKVAEGSGERIKITFTVEVREESD